MYLRRHLEIAPAAPAAGRVATGAAVIEVRSSDGETVYPVRLDPPFCPCRGFGYGRKCRHLAEARARQAETAGSAL
jgi:hypothetical protein